MTNSYNVTFTFTIGRPDGRETVAEIQNTLDKVSEAMIDALRKEGWYGELDKTTIDYPSKKVLMPLVDVFDNQTTALYGELETLGNL